MKDRLLLHVCCALCLPGPLRALTEEGFEVEGYFYNPNIHPLLEFRKRLKAVKTINERLRVPFHYAATYGLNTFLLMLDGEFGPSRCPRCYAHRLRETARFARLHGFRFFSSTLLVSHEQQHELVVAAGEHAAAAEGVEFVARDFRPFAEEGKQLARKASIYRQQYCGCVFSEYDRYASTGLELYKGGKR